MNEAFDAGALGHGRKPSRPPMMDEIEALLAVLMLLAVLIENADEIDDRVGAGNHRGEGALVAEIGTERRDLADIAHRP